MSQRHKNGSNDRKPLDTQIFKSMFGDL